MMQDPQSNPLKQIANSDYETALRKGFWHSVLAWLTRDTNDLLPFDEVRKQLPLQGQHDAGMREISIDQIVGSEGRYHDFDRTFLPRQSTTSGRWISIDMAHLQDVALPPIEVYKVGEVYFVKDGNHRVSVARERGQKFIDAHVIELKVPLSLDKDTQLEDLINRKEEIDFLAETHLNELRPEPNVRLTVPGGYDILLEHIRTHRWFMGEKRKAEVPWREAVEGWYDEVYLPLNEIIRENNILRDFPDRSEADLYLWIIEHLWYLRESYKNSQASSDGEVSLETAARHFAETYSEAPLHRLVNALRDFFTR